MNNKQKQERRELIASSIKEETHRTVSIKLPIATITRLKASAKKQGRLFSSFVSELAERGGEL
jgi:predicted DNA-binding protein